MKKTVTVNTLQELDMLYGADLKRYMSEVIGHKVDEIMARPKGFLHPGEYIIRFRHEHFAYSVAHFFQTENGVIAKLENFETGVLEDINKDEKGWG